jgi:hypothetical protein
LFDEHSLFICAMKLPDAEPDEQGQTDEREHHRENTRSESAIGDAEAHDILQCPSTAAARLQIYRSSIMPIIKIFVLACLIGIVVSLGSGMYHLMTDKGDSKKMVKALTLRVGLSVGLFILLLIAWSQGLIEPHGLR